MIEINSKNARIWSRLGPSGAFGIAALDLAEKKSKTLMLTADLCFFSGLERYREKFSDRLYNFGIAEQNMMGAAGGLAKEGFVPFVNTYASFATSRCLDQVRVNMAYMNLPIKLVGLTSGYGAGILGATHMSIEDIAIMRALPNITVISPADGAEIIKCIIAVADTKSPTYIRLTGPMNLPIVYESDYNFEIGKAIELRKGEDVCFIATGSMVFQALKAAEELDQKGISCSVINMHTIKPLDVYSIENAAKSHKLIVTVEEHSILGGLGSAVCEYISQNDCNIPIQIIGIKDLFVHAGQYEYQLEMSGLASYQIVENVINRFHNLAK